MNAEKFVQEQIDEGISESIFPICSISQHSLRSPWFIFTGVERPSTFRPYGTRSIFGKEPFTAFNSRRRDFVWRGRRMCLSTLFRRLNGFPFFSRRHIRLESRVYQYVPCSSAHRMTFHASTLKCLRLCTAMWGSCHTPVLPSIFGGDISCDAPRRRIVLAISRALLWSPDSLGVKLTIPI